MSCMFQSCAPSPDNTKSIKAQAPAEPEMRILVKRKLTVGGLIGCLASVPHYHKINLRPNEKSNFYFLFPTCNFYLEYDSRFSVALFQTCAVRKARGPSALTHLHFPNKTIQRCAQHPNNSCTCAVGTKSFPAPASNVVGSRKFSVRSLLRQPRSALEAGPSEAHAISFVHTPRPHLHRKDCTFSYYLSLPKE